MIILLIVIMLILGIECLGPTFMKLGQWIATRRDIFSNDICDTLSRLQRQTPAHSWAYTRSILKSSYGKEWKKLFVKFDDDLIGSGCCAQVILLFIFFNLKSLHLQYLNFFMILPAKL